MNMKELIGACLTGITSLALQADPQIFWCRGGDLAADDAFAIEGQGTSYCGWQDGNIMKVVGSTNYFPTTEMRDTVKLKTDGGLTYNGADPLRIHTFSFYTGWRIFSGNGNIEIGAGGIDQHAGSWDGYCINLTGGLRLTSSQSWALRNGVAFSDYNPANAVNTASVCPVTADPGVVLTITTKSTQYTKYTGVKFYGAANDFSQADIVLDSQWLHLADADARICAKSITLDGTRDPLRTRIYAEKVREPVIDSDFSSHFILKGGAELKLYSGCYRLRDDILDHYFSDIVYDLEKVTVATGTNVFGNGYSYSIKDGGVMSVEVLEGAAIKFAQFPKSGRIKVSGAGDVYLATSLNDVDFDENFTGKAIFKSASFAIPSISEYNGFSIVLEGASAVAVHDVSNWPEGTTIQLKDTSTLYVPDGSEIGEGCISIHGTTATVVEAKGLTEVQDEKIILNEGDVIVVAGDGFTEKTEIELAGGSIYFPFSVTVASPVSVTANSKISTRLDNTTLFTGPFSVSATLYSSNDLQQVKSIDATLYPCGRTVFAGDGVISAGGVVNQGGAMEFRGCEWNFPVTNTHLSITTHGVLIELTDEAKISFAAGDSSEAGRKGFYVCNANGYPGTLMIKEKSEFTLGDYRCAQFGEASFKAFASLVIDDATMRISGSGEFNNGGNSSDKMQGHSDYDRCSMFNMTIRNGGVLETDRILGNIVATHTVRDSNWLGTNYVEGIFIHLDGGTYKLGPDFGLKEENGQTKWYSNQHPNQLFSSLTMRNVGNTIGLTNTAEIAIHVGEDGGIFDLSGTNPYNLCFTNTVMGVYIPLTDAQKKLTAFEGMEHLPCLGPRWSLSGPLCVKGNGHHELVLNGIDVSELKNISADGAKLKVIDTNGVETVMLDAASLGAVGSAFSVESETGEKSDISIANLTVAAGGWYAPEAFDCESVTIGNVIFGLHSVIAARSDGNGNPIRIPVTGSATLSGEMGYCVSSELPAEGILIDPDGGIVAEDGIAVEWTRAEGSVRKIIAVENGAVRYRPYGTRIIVK